MTWGHYEIDRMQNAITNTILPMSFTSLALEHYILHTHTHIDIDIDIDIRHHGSIEFCVFY